MSLRNLFFSLLLLLIAGGCQELQVPPLPPAPPPISPECEDTLPMPIEMLAAMRPLVGNPLLLVSTFEQQPCTTISKLRASSEWTAIKLDYDTAPRLRDVILIGQGQLLSLTQMLNQHNVTNPLLMDIATNDQGGLFIATVFYQEGQRDLTVQVIYRDSEGTISITPLEYRGWTYRSDGQFVTYKDTVYFLYSVDIDQKRLISLSAPQGGQDLQVQTLWTLDHDAPTLDELTPFDSHVSELHLFMMGDLPIVVGALQSVERHEQSFYMQPFLIQLDGTINRMTPYWETHGRWKPQVGSLGDTTALLCTDTSIFAPANEDGHPRFPLPDDDCMRRCERATMCRVFDLATVDAAPEAPSLQGWQILTGATLQDMRSSENGPVSMILGYNPTQAYERWPDLPQIPNLIQYPDDRSRPFLSYLQVSVRMDDEGWEIVEEHESLVHKPAQMNDERANRFTTTPWEGRLTTPNCFLTLGSGYHYPPPGIRTYGMINGSQLYRTCL